MSKPLLYRVLVLEDDLEAAGKILNALFHIEGYLAPYDLDVTLLSTCEAMEELVNGHPERLFDVILLDRDCKLRGSFHTLDFDRFGVENIVSISSTPEWNRHAQALGITYVVPKSFSDLDGFAEKVGSTVLEILR